MKGPASSATATTTLSNVSPSDPSQTGTASNCNKYYTVVSGNSYNHIKTIYRISFSLLYKWNPEIGSNCQTLRIGYSVCMAASSTSGPTQSGIISGCNRYYTVVDGDSCNHIEILYGITFAQLYRWNPAIGSNCQTLGVGDSVCVGVLS